jgi:Flp pilus assembly protein protease CpaA
LLNDYDKEGKMPPIFKAITSICVWILFIHGIVAIGYGGYDMWVVGGGALSLMAAIACAIGTANLLMAAVAAKLRGMMQ